MLKQYGALSSNMAASLSIVSFKMAGLETIFWQTILLSTIEQQHVSYTYKGYMKIVVDLSS